jgi:hypothetical protein
VTSRRRLSGRRWTTPHTVLGTSVWFDREMPAIQTAAALRKISVFAHSGSHAKAASQQPHRRP